jgi:phosphatidylglycerophosphate synthase
MPSSKPSIPELRALAQPPTVVGRASGEHWAGRLYMRHVSIYLTRLLLPHRRITPDMVTWWMILAGVASAAVLAVPPWWSAVAAFALIQLQHLFDCSDGELARLRGDTGPVGVYLDRVGHNVTESLLLVAVGVRADGGYGDIGGWTTWGLLGALFVMYNRAETDLVYVARSVAGLGPVDDRPDVATPRAGSLAALRRAARIVPFHRAIGAQELTLLAIPVAVIDVVAGSLAATQWFARVLVVLAAVVAAGHLVGVLSSSRLR